MTRSEIDAEIRSTLAEFGEYHEPAGVWSCDRAIWNAACEACAKACEGRIALIEFPETECADRCRTLKAKP